MTRAFVRRLVALAFVPLAAAGCDELLNEPSALPTGLAFSFAEIAQLDELSDAALRQADQIRIRIDGVEPSSGITSIDRTDDFSWTSGETRSQITIEMSGDTGAARVQLSLTAGGSELFTAEGVVTLTRGETTPFDAGLVATIATVSVSGPTTITTIGEVSSYSLAAFYATGQEVTGVGVQFESLDPEVMRSVGTNAFEALADGTARIVGRASDTGDFNGATADTLTITVEAAVTRVELSRTSVLTQPGLETTLQATALDAGERVLDREITWTIADPGVATVVTSDRGRSATITGVADGVTTATVSSGAASSTVQIEVVSRVGEIILSASGDLSMEVEDTRTITTRILDLQGTEIGIPLEWTNSNPEVLGVQNLDNGRRLEVTGLARGLATLTASAFGVSASLTFEVGLGSGDVQVTLTWNNESDLDLWVISPLGDTVYYANSISESGGRLDVDDVDGFGPENIFWPTGAAPAGTYRVIVNYFSGNAPADASVRVEQGGFSKGYGRTIGVGEQVEFVTFTLGQPLPSPSVVLDAPVRPAPDRTKGAGPPH